MEYFLRRIARHLYSQYGNSLHNHCLVFPNRRAGLFFKKYLAEEIARPVWTPAVMTVNDLFRSFSKLQQAENEILIFELYNSYKKVSKQVESFDDFYFWGDMLLNDFDDVDKYLSDASTLFRNISDLKKIDQEFGGLTPEQVEIIRRFWTNIDPGRLTKEKSGFLNIWSILYDLYVDFRESLKSRNIAYEGMIFRDVAENHVDGIISGLQWETLHFAGFNALNRCETTLLTALKKAGKGRFYWDYDESYISGGRFSSAGYFIRENIAVFGNDMPGDWNYNTFLSRETAGINRRIINTSSDMAQVKLIPGLISKLPGFDSENAHETAVILADETLLIPFLSSLPDNSGNINITMGFPLRHTAVYAFIRRIMEMQVRARSENGTILFSAGDCHRITGDNLISGLLTGKDHDALGEIAEKKLLWVPEDLVAGTEILSKIFVHPSSPKQMSDYLRELLIIISSGNYAAEAEEIAETPAETLETAETIKATKADASEQKGEKARQRITDEFIYRTLLSLNRIDAAAENTGIKPALNTWIRILDRILSKQSLPFTGEPLSGIQVMGILESRTLDFKNIIMLSVNEGVLPAVSTSSSFIPFSLREAFGLPSVNHQESIYAYHFFRLLHRSENVTFIYNSDSEGLKSGEISRFLQQMKYGGGPVPEISGHSFSIQSQKPLSEKVERTEEHTRRLVERFCGPSEIAGTSGNSRTSGTSVIDDKGRSKTKTKTGTGRKYYISPSAINTWLHCRMKFYYRYVNDLREREVITEDIDPAMLGTLLHESIRNLYEKYAGRVLDPDETEAMLRNRQLIESAIDKAIEENFRSENDFPVSGNELIIREVLVVFVKRILQRDKMYAPLTILSFEKFHDFRIEMNACHDMSLLTGGRIDRIDMKQGIVRIIDYKTGIVRDSIASTEELFEEDRNRDLDGWLQTLIYCEAYLSKNPDAGLFPAIYKIRKDPGKDPSEMLRLKPDRSVNDYHIIREEFLTGLKILLEKIFSNSEAFTMTEKA